MAQPHQPTPNDARAGREFNELVAQLERKDSRLRGSRRRECFDAFLESREGTRALVEEIAAARWLRNKIGALIAAVREGQHLEQLPPLSDSAEETGVMAVEPPEPCPDCGTGAGLHVHDCPRASEAA